MIQVMPRISKSSKDTVDISRFPFWDLLVLSWNMRRSGEVRLVKVDKGGNNENQPKMNRATTKSAEKTNDLPLMPNFFQSYHDFSLEKRELQGIQTKFARIVLKSALHHGKEGIYAHIYISLLTREEMMFKVKSNSK